MTFIDLKKLMPAAINRYNMGRETQAALICEGFRNMAPGIIWEDAADHVKPKFFKRGTLYISVPSSIYAQRVYVHRHDLIMKLNLNMDGHLVKEIRTLVEA